MDIAKLIERLNETANRDPSTVWYSVASDDSISIAESEVCQEIPDMLKGCYTEISNGGFGPGYKLVGLPGGHESSWGDLLQTTIELRRHEDCEHAWLPIIDWGCAEFTIVDCADEDQIVSLYDGEFHFEEYSLETLLERWTIGEVPDL